MTEPSTKEQHIYRLSTLDQSVSRTFITIAFCFPCANEHVPAATARFLSTIKELISHRPELAGDLRPASSRDGAERGYLEVAVCLNMINNFTATVKNLAGTTDEEELSYERLSSKRFPADKLESMHLAPLAQKTETSGGKAFAAQLNIISGGVIAVLQLHHAIADLAGFRTIVSLCSTSASPRNLTHDYLSQQAVSSFKSRDLLSDAGGLIPADSVPASQPASLVFGEAPTSDIATCVMGFNLKLIDETTAMVNDRFIGPDFLRRKASVRSFHILASILWRAIIRARKASGLLNLMPTESAYDALPNSKVIVPINIRERMQPELKATYFGNAIAHGSIRQSIVSLDMPMGVSEIQATASLVHAAIGDVTERAVHLAIAKAQQSDYSNNTITTAATTLTDVVLTSWSDLLPEEAHLCLGLGEPSFVRKLSGTKPDEGCNIHARPRTGGIMGGIWEVTITLAEKAMGALLDDEGVMRFVDYANGERYVNGRPMDLDAGHQVSLENEVSENALSILNHIL